MDRAAELRADYDRLGSILDYEGDGAKAAALARERRLISVELERLEAAPGEAPYVDEVAAKRSRRRTSRPSSRRRQSG